MVSMASIFLALSACTPTKGAETRAGTVTANGSSPARAEALAPGQHTAVIDGSAIVYHVFGKGPVLLAHSGGPGCDWAYLRMPEVEKVATVVYIEPIGTGASARLANPAVYSLELDASNVEGLRIHLGLDKIVLLGHSYGGFVAQTYALMHPQHLGGLVLYDTSPTNGPDFEKDVESNTQWFKNEPWFAQARSALDAWDTPETDDEATRALRNALPFYFADWTGHAKEYESLPPVRVYAERSTRKKAHAPKIDAGAPQVYDVRKRLGEIAAPTLIVVGTKDFVCSMKMANIMHRGIRNSRLTVFQHSGHFAHIEESQEYAHTVGEFVSQLNPPVLHP